MRPTCVIVLTLLVSGCLVDRERYLALRALLVDDDGDGWTEHDGDCDDTNPAVHPRNADACNGLDDDCDGSTDEEDRTWYPDLDEDTWGASTGALLACDGPAGWVMRGDDCDDADARVHPDADESCNLADDDCDGAIDEGHATSTWYADDDGDGFGDPAWPTEACTAPPGYAAAATDCDDGDAAVNTDATEVCENGLDDDCDGGATGCTWTSTSDARLLGDRAGTGAGASLAAGDVDGDGLDDLFVGSAGGEGAWLYGGGPRRAGDTLLATAARTSLLNDPDYFGPDFRLGAAVTLCDFDGDHVPELVTTGYEAGLPSILFVFAAADTGTRSLGDAVYATMAFGELEGAALGCRDVNDDGADDLLVGTPGYDTEDTEDAGALHVMYGGEPELSSSGELEPTISATYGATAGQALGASLAPLDLGGDGVIDLLAGAGSRAAVGTDLAWVLTGPLGESSTHAAERLLTAATSANASVAAGDLDGDGVDDMVVGAPADATRGAATGAVYVVSGGELGAGGEASRYVDDATIAVLAGASAGVSIGVTVAVIPGIDGDPARLVVGGARDDAGGAGAVYLWDGDALDGELTTASATATWEGSAAGDALGSSVEAAGDLDGDGWFDLAFGAPGADDPAADAGAVLLLYGTGL